MWELGGGMNTTISSVTPPNITSMSRLCALGATIGGKKYAEWLPNEASLLAPLRWRNPRHVELRSDLFHENVTDEMLDRIFAVMALCPQHTFQVLTKRPERMAEYCATLGRHHEVDRVSIAAKKINAFEGFWYAMKPGGKRWHLPNVWLGVSVEDQKAADARIPLLLQTPAAVRFISYEPALGPVDLEDLSRIFPDGSEWRFGCLAANDVPPSDDPDFGGARIDWVICGGESGPGARPMHPDWARSVRDQCVAAGVPFFFKQWGEWLPQTGGIQQLESLPQRTPCMLMSSDGHCGHSQFEMDGHERVGRMLRVGKKAAGNLLDGQVWQQYPEVVA
jgi:protein gp37